jgi:hypothetical protein
MMDAIHSGEDMSIIIVHDPLKKTLASADSPLEVCTSDGQLLGYFTPVKERRLKLDPGISNEEIERRFTAGGGRALADILRDLEKRS